MDNNNNNKILCKISPKAKLIFTKNFNQFKNQIKLKISLFKKYFLKLMIKFYNNNLSLQSLIKVPIIIYKKTKLLIIKKNNKN